MPYYGMPLGTEYDEVAFGFNKGIITDLLRGKLGFEGIICTDWGLVTDAAILGQNAGCDQLGGEARPELVVHTDLVPSTRRPTRHQQPTELYVD